MKLSAPLMIPTFAFVRPGRLNDISDPLTIPRLGGTWRDNALWPQLVMTILNCHCAECDIILIAYWVCICCISEIMILWGRLLSWTHLWWDITVTLICAMVSQITSVSIVCLFNRLFRRISKKTSKLRFTGLMGENSPVTAGFPSQRASNAENISIWWRHHDMKALLKDQAPILTPFWVTHNWHLAPAHVNKCVEYW